MEISLAELRYSEVMRCLRDEMTNQKITFEGLSKLVKVPVSTLKKWFANQDGSFNNVDLICRCLGYNMDDLLSKLGRQNVRTFTFNSKQQNHFKNNPMCFRIYWYLVYEKLEESEICQICRIQEKELRKNILTLDRLGLLKVSEVGKTQLPRNQPIRWKFLGHFMRELLINWGSEIFRKASSNPDSKDEENLTLLQFFQLTPDSRIELLKDIANLEEKYARRTIAELNVKRDDLIKLRFLLVMTTGSVFQKEHSILSDQNL